MTGNRTLDKIIILANALVAISALALIVYSHLYIKTPLINQLDQMENLKNTSMQIASSAPLEFKRVILNLPSRQTRLRFLEIQVNIETFEPEQKSLLNSKEYVVYDGIINTAGAMEPNDLNSVTGKILLEGRLKKYLNEFFQDDVVKKIYFSKFVVQ